MTFKKLGSFVSESFSEKVISEQDIPKFKHSLSSENVLKFLKEVLETPDLFKTVLDRSYSHTLGFDKIVLFDLSKDISPQLPKTQIRLHTWDISNTSVPMQESLHEHSFDFVSKVLFGEFQNHKFSIKDIPQKDSNSFQNFLTLLTQEMKVVLNNGFSAIEIKRLQELGSDQNFNQEDIKRLKESVFKTDLEHLSTFYGYYKSNRVRGERKDYQHVFQKLVSIVPHSVESYKKDDVYFHHNSHPHRLYLKPQSFVATLCLTTPVPDNPQGGSLQRLTDGNDKNYKKPALLPQQLEEKIKKVIRYLS